MTAQPVRFGVVGAGAIANAYGAAAQSADGVRITAVADLRQDAAAALAAELDCASFDDHRALLDAGLCDAVVVCTPPASHPEICLDAIARGVAVLCEKPLSIDLASAQRMVEAADEAGVILTMASKFRYVDDVSEAKALIDAGTIGEVVLFENTFTGRVDMRQRWNADPATSGGGVLIDNGTHSVDVIRFFLGPIAEVHAVEGKNVQGLAVEDTARIFVRSTAGVMGSIDLSWSLHKDRSSYVEVYGADGTLQVGWQRSRYRRTGDSDWTSFGRGYDKVGAFRNQLENFCRALHGEEDLRITAVDAIASVAVIEKAYESLRKDHWIAVGPEPGALPA